MSAWGPAQWRSIAEEIVTMTAADRERFVARDDYDFQLGYLIFGWWNFGQVVYEVSHSMAACFALTSKPVVDWSRLPHRSFAMKVPGEFVGGDRTDDAWILVGRTPKGERTLINARVGTFGVGFSLKGDADEATVEAWNPEMAAKRVLLLRVAANALAFITEHRECVFAKNERPRSGIVPSAFDVRAPRDLIITREFRDAARAAACAQSLTAVRRALAHFVRGHWRNQLVGEGRTERKLTWVRPHKRGDESLGSVVSRIERITKEKS